MTDATSGLQLRSLIRKSGELELSLLSVPTPEPKADEVVVRDLDMDRLTEVRDLWQFYRDRRPDAYGPLVQP